VVGHLNPLAKAGTTDRGLLAVLSGDFSCWRNQNQGL